MQARSMSAVEAVTSTGVGFIVSLALTLTVLPAFGYSVTSQHAWAITAIYTAASIARSYLVRRAFNKWGAAQ